MTKEQKEKLVFAVMSQVGNLIEFPDMLPIELQEVPITEIRKQLAKWMSKLPTQTWDTRLDVN